MHRTRHEEYGEAAIKATKHIQETEKDPRVVWKETVEKIFGAGTNLAKKPCPRSAYLGLCEDGLVAGVPKGIYIREQGGKKRNK